MTNDIEFLRNAFGKLEKMGDATYEKLCAILDAADDKAIMAAKDANIKFVSSLALNRAIRRGLVY